MGPLPTATQAPGFSTGMCCMSLQPYALGSIPLTARRQRIRVAAAEPYRTLFLRDAALRAFVEECARGSLPAREEFEHLQRDCRLLRLHGVSSLPPSFQDALAVADSMRRWCHRSMP